MTKDEALKLALEYVELVPDDRYNAEHIDREALVTAIREALAQPEQEPVAWVSSEELLVMRGNALGGAKDWRINVGLVKQDGDVGLYTTPPQRKPLTDEQEREAFEKWCFSVGLMAESYGILSESSHCGTAWKAWKAKAAHGIKE